MNDLKHKMAAVVIYFDEKPSCYYSILGFLPKSNFFDLGRIDFISKRLDLAHSKKDLFLFGHNTAFKEYRRFPSFITTNKKFLTSFLKSKILSSENVK